jgi:hypothetical protein
VSPEPTPQPIPAEGDVQIFADPECTSYATGSETTVYARINEPWGYGEGWSVSDGESENRILCVGPDEEDPDIGYFMQVWVDWQTQEESSTPFRPDDVIALINSGGTTVSNPTVIFSRPS